MNQSTIDQHQEESPLDAVVQEFLAELRQGSQPEIDAYCEKHKEFGEELREILSAVMLLEIAKPAAPETNTSTESGRPLPWERLGDFRLVREAGRGGMGIVYEAFQESLSRRVALKTLPHEIAWNTTQLERFQREARAVASLHHTNIVPVFAVGEACGVHFYVMPFINGSGLEQVIKELRSLSRPNSNNDQPPERDVATQQLTTDVECERSFQTSGSLSYAAKDLSSVWERLGQNSSSSTPQVDSSTVSGERRGYWYRVARIGLQVADALEYALGQGVLHRDIKPSNLLLDTDGIIWVTDFGLAKVTESEDLTRTGEMVGTLRYLAPERMRGVHDIRGDIYGLGLTLYELLTLRVPFEATHKAELTRQILEVDPLRPRSIDPRIPVDLETIVRKAIAKDPRDRYQTPGAMAEDLRLFLGDRPIKSRRTSYVEHSWRWCRRNPMVAGLLVCVLLLMATTIGVLLSSNHRIRNETSEKIAALQSKNIAMSERQAAFDARKQSETLAKSRYYAANVNLAGQAYHRGEVTRAEDLLESVIPGAGEPDFRGFEWNFLRDSLHSGLRLTLHHPKNEVRSSHFSTDGRRLLIVGGSTHSGFWRIVDIVSGEIIFDQPDLGTTISGCAFAPDGSKFVLGRGDGQLIIYDVDKREKLHVEDTDVMLKSLAWSPDGKQIIIGGEQGELLFLSVPAFEQIRLPKSHRGPVLTVFFSHDGHRLYSSADWGKEGTVCRQWDMTVWPPVESRKFPGKYLTDESPDGKSLVGVSLGTVHILDAVSGDEKMRASIAVGPMVTAKYSADGQSIFIAARTDRTVRRLSATTLEVVSSHAQNHTLSDLALDSTGQYWAAGDSRGDVRIWEVEPPPTELEIQDDSIYDVFYISGSNDPIVAGPLNSRRWSMGDNKLKSWHTATGLRAVSADGKTLACFSDTHREQLDVWRNDYLEPTRIELPVPIYERCVAVSGSGRYLAVRGGSTRIMIYDLNSLTPQLLHSLEGWCHQIVFSPNEKYLVGGEQYGTVCGFDLTTGSELPNYAEFDSWWSWGMGIAFSRDSFYVAAGNESGTIRVWETKSQKLVATMTGQPGEIRSLAFFPDGHRLASGGASDVRIWDYQSGQELLSLPTGDSVESLAINDIGDTIAATIRGGRLKAWSTTENNNR